MTDQRSTIHGSNIQELLDASSDAGTAIRKGQQQYQTPDWLAEACAQLLLTRQPAVVFDPQCAAGHLLRCFQGTRLGWEIDNRTRIEGIHTVNRVVGNCVRLGEIFDEFWPTHRFPAIVANPPFGLKWKHGTSSIDSTEWTWNFILTHLAERGCGYLIGNANTLEKLGIDTHRWTYLYQRLPAAGIWEGVGIDVGIAHFAHIAGSYDAQRQAYTYTETPTQIEMARNGFNVVSRLTLIKPFDGKFYLLNDNFGLMRKVLAEEESDRPKFNIYLGRDGILRTYLSIRDGRRIPQASIHRLSRINGCHPLTLTTERETRKLLAELVADGTYTVQPEARQAIDSALAEVASLACPIMPVTDFELVAYSDEEEHLTAKNPEIVPLDAFPALTPGRKYEVLTGSYTFREEFTRKKLHFDEETGRCEIDEHDCQLSGSDRYIQITDDRGRAHRFMDRPDGPFQHPESLLWELFHRPTVSTVAELHAEQVAANRRKMEFAELVAGYRYFPGQLEYYTRMGCKDYGLIGADVGTGKTLGALTMVNLKSPGRTLIIAPQGTMRSSGDEGEIDYQASQWVQEIERFAPTEPVFQLFSLADYHAVLRANGGQLPLGIYITYPQAYFSNHAFETLPSTWDNLSPMGQEEKFLVAHGLPTDRLPNTPVTDYLSRAVGKTNDAGIRCISRPSLATIMATAHGEWDMVIIDEAHLCCNLDAQVTQNLLRLQPRYRFAMTATPIPNIVTNLFSLAGWLCVPDWYKGERRNAAWPYSVDEHARFASTFLSTEFDLTAQAKAKAAGKRSWRQSGTRSSPVISAPARLLKLLKPFMAYISKEDCNPDLQPCEVRDVRVPMGREQTEAYRHWLDRSNYVREFKNPLTIARVQLQRLRGICAAPAGLDYVGRMTRSNFNPKTVTILELIRDCLGRGEQVVVVSARVGQSCELSRRLAEAGVPLARIDSTVPASLHTAEANRFKRGDARVMLMGIKCAQGHSFEKCPNLIIGSLEWSYGTLHQAKGRVWRLTSRQPVKVWVVLHENTIEELLFDRVALKQDAATMCLHGQRVPRDFKTLDASEVLAEHIVDYTDAGTARSESQCEDQWPDLRRQLILANRNPQASYQLVA